MATSATAPVTLHQIWQYHHAADFAAGVRLLDEHNPGAVTNLILDRLKKAAAPGKKPNRYELGKLSEALQKTRINPTPDPSPDASGRGDVEPSVANTATATAPNQPAISNQQSATNPQQTAPKPQTPGHPPSPSTSPLPVGEGQGVGLNAPIVSSPLAKSLHKRHDHVHALLTAAKTDEERAKYAKEIMEDIVPALDAEYDRLRAGVQAEPVAVHPGSIPGTILSTGDARTFKKLQSVRSRISTLKGKIKTEKNPDRKAKLQQELEDKTTEKERLENELA